MRSWWNLAWPPVVAVILFLAGWQLAVSAFHIEAWLLPSPLQIVRKGWEQASVLTGHTWATVKLTLMGFLIGVGTGLLIAMILHLIPFLRSALYPLLILSQNVPAIILAPLLMIWFGFGLLPKLIVITLVCFFPVAVAAMSGFNQTDRMMLNYMRMAGAGKRQIFTKLELPHALPSIFSGLKIAATYSVMGAVIAEWMGADQGIGYYMNLQKSGYRTDLVFAAVFIIVALSLLLFGLIALLEKGVIRWRPQRQNS
ncbi:ABC transporter permease [Paenibacillus sp. JX-17]|uniref:ABC transporter permease n=1 Tax=Paenibacillus lacisoli TaxID=3064525 RepID=A0ABT9CBY7_9BACL|nr:ABC transporter permease [Paenibacillus sp. JX-17]MDO7906784.1 ABC transporter permease [Paenibacillus sp. JX-17]